MLTINDVSTGEFGQEPRNFSSQTLLIVVSYFPIPQRLGENYTPQIKERLLKRRTKVKKEEKK